MSRDTHTYQEEINTAFKSIKDFIRYDIQSQYNCKCDIFLPQNQMNNARRESL